ncbi:MAG: methyltransferase domain-containing protein [Thermodesulfobacteriota bacterium]
MELSKIKEHYSRYVRNQTIFEVNRELVKILVTLKPVSVFEFGCNTGFNLDLLLHELGCVVYGIDLSPNAIDQGRKMYKLRIDLGDEFSLGLIRPNSFSLSFTCSVLNHLPDETVNNVINNLKAISKDHVLLVESQFDKAERWFKHNYENWGFKKISTVRQKPPDHDYDYWLL